MWKLFYTWLWRRIVFWSQIFWIICCVERRGFVVNHGKFLFTFPSILNFHACSNSTKIYEITFFVLYKVLSSIIFYRFNIFYGNQKYHHWAPVFQHNHCQIKSWKNKYVIAILSSFYAFHVIKSYYYVLD